MAGGDHRTRVTKMLIRRAFTELLRVKPVQSISIKELCEKAGVNRGTFYAHYTDLYDMLEQMESELLSEFRAVLDRHTSEELTRDLSPLLSDVFCFVEKNRALMPVFLSQQTADWFLRRFSQVIYDMCLRE